MENAGEWGVENGEAMARILTSEVLRASIIVELVTWKLIMLGGARMLALCRP